MSDMMIVRALKRKARAEFEEYGRVRYDTARRLMNMGIVVQAMEEQWARVAS